MFSQAGCNLDHCLFLRGSSFSSRMICWKTLATTLLNSSTRARALTKQPLETTLEKGQDKYSLKCFYFLYLIIFSLYFVSSFPNTQPCVWQRLWFTSAYFLYCSASSWLDTGQSQTVLSRRCPLLNSLHLSLIILLIHKLRDSQLWNGHV